MISSPEAGTVRWRECCLWLCDWETQSIQLAIKMHTGTHTFQLSKTRYNILTSHKAKLLRPRTRQKENFHLVFLICTLPALANPWVSWSQTSTSAGCAAGLGFVWCFTVYLVAWVFSWGWQVTLVSMQPIQWPTYPNTCVFELSGKLLTVLKCSIHAHQFCSSGFKDVP